MKRLTQMLSFLTVIAVILAATLFVPASPPGRAEAAVTPFEKTVNHAAPAYDHATPAYSDEIATAVESVSTTNRRAFEQVAVPHRFTGLDRRFESEETTSMRDRYGTSTASRGIAERGPTTINPGFGLENRSRAKI